MKQFFFMLLLLGAVFAGAGGKGHRAGPWTARAVGPEAQADGENTPRSAGRLDRDPLIARCSPVAGRVERDRLLDVARIDASFGRVDDGAVCGFGIVVVASCQRHTYQHSNDPKKSFHNIRVLICCS